MPDHSDFDVQNFLPYLLNQAAEAASLSFQEVYRARYGMARPDWRVLFHLGRFGPMTAREIVTRSRMNKTKVSRAVARLEELRFLTRTRKAEDRRAEILALTAQGQSVYADLVLAAQAHDAALLEGLQGVDAERLKAALRQLVESR